jgi:hypothetical protein
MGGVMMLNASDMFKYVVIDREGRGPELVGPFLTHEAASDWAATFEGVVGRALDLGRLTSPTDYAVSSSLSVTNPSVYMEQEVAALGVRATFDVYLPVMIRVQMDEHGDIVDDEHPEVLIDYDGMPWSTLGSRTTTDVFDVERESWMHDSGHEGITATAVWEHAASVLRNKMEA